MRSEKKNTVTFSYGSDYESLEYVFRGCNGND